MQDWNVRPSRQLVTSKVVLIASCIYSNDSVQGKYKGLGYHIRSIQEALGDGLQAQKSNNRRQQDAGILRRQGQIILPFDEATQGDHVTFDIYEKALLEPLLV